MGMMDPSRESGLGSDSDNMAELAALLNTEIPECQNNLTDSYHNLERVAEYCEGNYFQSENKRGALEETKNYTTQSLASVAYQINTLAYNFLQLLDLQAGQLAEMESQMNHIAQTVMIHKEKVARREIGVLTANKTSSRQYKIIAPANPEKPIKYERKPIDFNALDDVGHGARSQSASRVKLNRTGSTVGVGPAPTTKPPTPPSVIRSTGSLSKGSREYRTPPAVAPPQVPSHYAPNYPLGHPRRAGYSTLPLNSSVSQQQPPPQVMSQHSTSNSVHFSDQPMPPPPPSLSDDLSRSNSPPLPPPPAPTVASLEQDLASRYPPTTPPPLHTIVTDEIDLPGWVPKNYIEKVVAIYDYYADKEDELSFQENAVIYVLKKNDDGWWEGVMDGITGLFPGNYVEPCV